MTKHFIPYNPPYSSIESLQRFHAIFGACFTVASNLLRQTRTAFAASVEVTDRCNAGCHYCYVYQADWDQRQRIQGYMKLSAGEHRQKEKQVFDTLERLKEKGIVHVTVVGGETALAPTAIQRAAELFPVVWVVTNGAAKLPILPHSASVFVSIDGPPNYHNQSRDPLNFFSKHRYQNLSGMSAAITKNINESERGAYCHITLTRQSLNYFPETVDWLIKDVKKLRGVIVSGVATKNKTDPATLSSKDKQMLKCMIAGKAEQYGWGLFPFNQPLVNDFLFDDKYTIYDQSDCSVAQRVESLDFDGNNVGKCVLRNETDCETCVCNVTGLARAINHVHLPSILEVIRALFG